MKIIIKRIRRRATIQPITIPAIVPGGNGVLTLWAPASGVKLTVDAIVVVVITVVVLPLIQ